MDMNRRGLIGAALPLTVAAAPLRAWSTGGGDAHDAALAKLRAYVEENRTAFGLPGMTLVVVGADGYAGYITSGYADVKLRRPVQASDFFHVGSISKSFTAICVFRLLQAGRLRLDDDVRDHLKGLVIDSDERVTLQHLLNHSSGLPEDAPIAPQPGGRLWLGYRPGSHWSYSNLGYDLLTKVVQTLHGTTIERVIADEAFAPLAIPQARSALRSEDRSLYAVGYYPARLDVPIPRAAPLVEAPFETFVSGAGCVGMATPQMASYLRWLIAAGRGQGGPLLSDALAAQWTRPTVDAPGWAKGARYANGLAVVEVDGRTLLHHTGGMLAFASSLHVDPEAGVACFASTNFTGFTDYRPRDITAWACGLFRTAASGAPAPAPKPTAMVVERAADYAGVFQSADGERIEIRLAGTGLAGQGLASQGLELAFAGGACPLEPAGDNALLAHHPRFARYAFLVERSGTRPVAAWWGEREYAADPARLRGPAPAELAALAGRYDGAVTPTRIVARPTGLFADGITPLTRLSDGSWRPGKDDWTPERLTLDTPLNGRPQRLVASGDVAWRGDDRDEAPWMQRPA